jgi:CheY-like chemotaxis protein
MNNILVIDDDWALRDSISSYLGLKLKEYSVLKAEDGKKGIELMRSNPVSLILTDLEMPKKDGYQVMDFAKKNYPTVPVVVMTGSWSPELRALVHKTGAAHCLEKPFRFEELIIVIQNALGKESTVPSA